MDGSVPGKNSTVYTKPFYISSNKTEIKAYCSAEGFIDSKIASANYIKVPGGRKAVYHTKYSNIYNAGGDKGLIDGIRGTLNYNTGEWQGFEFNDLDVVIDLGSRQDIHTLSAGFLQNVNDWILFPEQVEYLSSADGITFTSLGIVKNKISYESSQPQLQEFAQEVKMINSRYIQVKAKNVGVLPAWHSSAGEKALIFIDEIEIK